jgi:hypothetical protein
MVNRVVPVMIHQTFTLDCGEGDVKDAALAPPLVNFLVQVLRAHVDGLRGEGLKSLLNRDILLLPIFGGALQELPKLRYLACEGHSSYLGPLDPYVKYTWR